MVDVKKAKRALCIFFDFYPSAMPGANRNNAMFKYLPEFGWEVHVLTARTKDYERRFSDKEKEMNPRITRTSAPSMYKILEWLEKVHLRGFVWAFFYPIFWEKRFSWFFFSIWKAMNLHRTHHFDCVITSAAPQTASLLGWFMKRFIGLKWICDNRDPYTSGPVNRWPSKIFFRIMKWFEGCWLSHADAVIYVTPQMKEECLKSFPTVMPKSVFVIENGFDREVPPNFPRLWKDGNLMKILYAGSLNFEDPNSSTTAMKPKWCVYENLNYDFSTRSPLPMIKVLKWLERNNSGLFEKIRFDVYGPSDPRNEILVEFFGLDQKIHFHGLQNHEEVWRKTCEADLLYLPMEVRYDGHETVFMSSKIYDYLASGRPVLVLSPECEASRLAERVGVGFRRDRTDIEGIATFLDELSSMDKMGLCPNWNLIRDLHRRNRVKEFSNILNKVVDNEGENSC